MYGDQKLSSVTTILSATKKDKGALDAWIERVGQEEADRIKNEASRVGTYLHEVIERMVAYRDLPRPTNWEMCKGYEMGYKIINTYFRNVNEIWGSEVSLFYPERYAGTTDLVGVYRDKPHIIDFKQSNKPKKRQWIEDYFCQLAAYVMRTMRCTALISTTPLSRWRYAQTAAPPSSPPQAVSFRAIKTCGFAAWMSSIKRKVEFLKKICPA